MDDQLLRYYNLELTKIRKTAANFAIKNPKIAGFLRMSPDAIEDPHVSRLIESFAFLTAEVQMKIDDDFPLLCNALMQQLYPHYLNPIPSLSVVEYIPDPSITVAYRVEKKTYLECETQNSINCRFQTCYDTDCYPLSVVSARLTRTFSDEFYTQHNQTKLRSILKIKLSTLDSSLSINELRPKKLRFFINMPSATAMKFYELIFRHKIGIGIKSSSNSAVFTTLPSTCIKPVGFDMNENLWPNSTNGCQAYQLLSEFFVYPEKFLFFDVFLDQISDWEQFDQNIELFILLDDEDNDIELQVSEKSFKLNCSPIINLFDYRSEPIKLDQYQNEYSVIPDVRKRNEIYIYSIQNVTSINDDNQVQSHYPLYGLNHWIEQENNEIRWYASRLLNPYNEHTGSTNNDFTISFTNSATNDSNDNVTINIDCLCTNGSWVKHMLFLGDKIELNVIDGSPAITNVFAIKQFTQVLNPTSSDRDHWRILSHLHLNYLSISDGDEGVSALKEILRLYDFKQSLETKDLIDGLVSIKSERTTKRSPSSLNGSVCQGIKIILTIDENKFNDTGCYLFSSILSHFFSLYASLNTFTELHIFSEQQNKVIYTWEPRVGSMTLL